MYPYIQQTDVYNPVVSYTGMRNTCQVPAANILRHYLVARTDSMEVEVIVLFAACRRGPSRNLVCDLRYEAT